MPHRYVKNVPLRTMLSALSVCMSLMAGCTAILALH